MTEYWSEHAFPGLLKVPLNRDLLSAKAAHTRVFAMIGQSDTIRVIE